MDEWPSSAHNVPTRKRTQVTSKKYVIIYSAICAAFLAIDIALIGIVAAQ